MNRPEHPRIRYAVVGLGNIAQVAVLPAFEHAGENSELVALVSSDPEKLAALGKQYQVGVTGDYDDLERIIRQSRADAVYVAVPNALHRGVTERAARVGAHVLCEKPMATTEEDCHAMIRACAESSTKLMIAYRLHFEAANLDAIERLQTGEIGPPRIFMSVFCQQVREGDIRTNASLGGGALFDMGIYCLNAARYLFGDEPTEVFAEQFFPRDERFEDVDEMTSVTLRFPGNRVAQFTASQGAADESRYLVVGTTGSLELNPAYQYRGELEETVVVGKKRQKKRFPLRDQFAPEIVYFSRSILEDFEPEPSGAEGLADVRIMEAIIESARTHRRVEVRPVAIRQRPGAELEMSKPPARQVTPVNAPPPTK